MMLTGSGSAVLPSQGIRFELKTRRSGLFGSAALGSKLIVKSAQGWYIVLVSVQIHLNDRLRLARVAKRRYALLCGFGGHFGALIISSSRLLMRPRFPAWPQLMVSGLTSKWLLASVCNISSFSIILAWTSIKASDGVRVFILISSS